MGNSSRKRLLEERNDALQRMMSQAKADCDRASGAARREAELARQAREALDAERERARREVDAERERARREVEAERRLRREADEERHKARQAMHELEVKRLREARRQEEALAKKEKEAALLLQREAERRDLREAARLLREAREHGYQGLRARLKAASGAKAPAVSPGKSKSSDEAAKRDEEHNGKPAASKSGYICDACDKDISGVRFEGRSDVDEYNNLDLCASCHSKGKYKKHRYVKVAGTSVRESHTASYFAPSFLGSDEVEKGAWIGSGGFGDVYKAKWKGTTYALKEVKVPAGALDRAKKDFACEFLAMAMLISPFVVRVKAAVVGRDAAAGAITLGVLMEYCSGGSLDSYLEANGPSLTWDDRYCLALDIARGMAELHSSNMIHRDVKSPNILIDSRGCAKLCDFGLVKLRETSRTFTRKGCVSLRWSPPEAFKEGKGTSTKAADVFSLGVVLWELAVCSTPRLPFADLEVNQVIGKLLSGGREVVPESTPARFAKIIRECWKEPSERPSAAAIVRELHSIMS